MKFKKAETIKEAYQVFDTHNALDKENKEFYIDIYNKDIKKLRRELDFNQNPNQPFFVTGQSGNGKSTALNFLSNKEIEKKYEIKYLNGNELLDLNDIDIIDVIITIGYAVIKGNQDLKNKFFNELEKSRKKKLGQLEQQTDTIKANKGNAGADLSFDSKISFLKMFKFGAGFFAKLKMEKEIRKTVREIFVLDKRELVDKVNDIILSYKEQQNSEKKLLIIIDDFEKIRKQDQTIDLFINNIDVFQNIKCIKIITFPVYLATKYSMYQNSSKFGIRISQNPDNKDQDDNDKEANNNKKNLREVINKRIKNKNLIDENAINKAVKYSGGNLRSLMMIMQKAVLNCANIDSENMDDAKITKLDVINAIQEIGELPALSIMSRISVLKFVLDKYAQPEDEKMKKDFIDLIQENSIFACFNGRPWYEVNPIIKDSVIAYSKK